MKIGLRLHGKVIGIEPSPIAGKSGDEAWPVYSNRDTIGPWEEVELTRHNDGSFDARFLSSNRQLSINPQGGLESREAGQTGGWESFYATEQPEGTNFLYRHDDVALLPVVLSIEEAA